MNDVIIGAWVAFFLLIRKIAFSMTVHYVAGFTEQHFGRLFAQTDRKKTIWRHYLENAQGKGHEIKDVTACDENSCSALRTV